MRTIFRHKRLMLLLSFLVLLTLLLPLLFDYAIYEKMKHFLHTDYKSYYVLVWLLNLALITLDWTLFGIIIIKCFNDHGKKTEGVFIVLFIYIAIIAGIVAYLTSNYLPDNTASLSDLATGMGGAVIILLVYLRGEFWKLVAYGRGD